jgi:hypothetical protein
LITYGGKEIIKTDFKFIIKTLENGDIKSLDEGPELRCLADGGGEMSVFM